MTETAAVWHVGGEDFNRSISTPAIQDDILFWGQSAHTDMFRQSTPARAHLKGSATEPSQE